MKIMKSILRESGFNPNIGLSESKRMIEQIQCNSDRQSPIQLRSLFSESIQKAGKPTSTLFQGPQQQR